MENDNDNEIMFIAKWHTVHVQRTWVKNSGRSNIHEIYKAWQRGLEAIVAYVPQYQLYQADCFGSAEQKQCRVLELFQYKTLSFMHTYTHIYTSYGTRFHIHMHALSIAESCNKAIVWKQEQSLDAFLEWANCTFRINIINNIIPDTSTTIT